VGMNYPVDIAFQIFFKMGIGPLSTRSIKPNFRELTDRNTHRTKTFYSNFSYLPKALGTALLSTDSTIFFF